VLLHGSLYTGVAVLSEHCSFGGFQFQKQRTVSELNRRGCVQTYRPPVSEYKVVREKASAEHRDIERALTRFIAKTGDTENLFPDDPYAFPCKSG